MEFTLNAFKLPAVEKFHVVTSCDNACDDAVHEPYLLNRVELINTLCSCHLWHVDRITLQKCKHPLLKAQAQGTKCGRQIDATTQEQMSATGVYYITNTKGSFTLTIRRGQATKLVAKKPVTNSHKWLLWSQATVLDQSCDCSCNAAEPISGTRTGHLQTLTPILCGDVSASRYERHQSQEVSVWRWESRTGRFVHQSPPVAIRPVASLSSWCE